MKTLGRFLRVVMLVAAALAVVALFANAPGDKSNAAGATEKPPAVKAGWSGLLPIIRRPATTDGSSASDRTTLQREAYVRKRLETAAAGLERLLADHFRDLFEMPSR